MGAVERDLEVIEGFYGGFSAFVCALDEVLLDEEGLVDFFEGAGVFAGGDGPGVEAYGASAIGGEQALHEAVVDLVEASWVYVEELER